MTDFDDTALVARCKAGEDAAFRELVDRYKDLVFGLIARAVPDRSRAEDLAQEVFLRVHKGLPYFRGEARLSTWIYKIVLNLCAQHSTRDRLLDFTLDEVTPSGRPRVEPIASDSTVGDVELRDRLEKAIARLPASQRVLVAAHYLEGVRYEDLAEAMGLPLGTVKTHLHRAKRQLRILLETELG
jgi:RNA polymerase sigma-70 factor (ECF subfamily)